MTDDELLRRYFLGELSEDESDELERRLLAEAELGELAEAIEGEVLEDYARGNLPLEGRRRVARFLKTSPSGRLRLAVIRGLGSLDTGRRARVLPFARPELPPSAVRAALAAMLVLAVAALLLARLTAIPGGPDAPGAPRVAESPAVEITPPVTVDSPPAPVPGPPAGRPEDRVAEAPPPAAPVPAPAPSLPPVVLQLALSTLRSQAETPEVSVPPGRAAELSLLLGPADGSYPSYRVSIQGPAGEEVLRREGLQPADVDGARVLAVQLEPNQVREGRYTVEIRGVTAAGEEIEIAFPEFDVRVPPPM